MKKLMKRLIAVAAAITMVMAMGITASAQEAEPTEGQTRGAATITVSNPTKGQTYAVYKLFDATTQNIETDEDPNYVISYTGTIPDVLNDYFEVVSGTTNNIKVKAGHETIDENEAAALKTWAQSATAIATAESDGTTPLTFKDLPYGYYVVTTTLGAGAVSVTSTNPTATVNDKNTTNPTDQSKTIVSTTDDLTNQSTNVNANTGSAKVGDKISYKVTFTANNYEGDANNATKMEQYVVTDTNSGLDIDTPTINITIQKQNGTSGLGDDQYVASTRKATIEKANDNSGTVTITIPWVSDDEAKTFLYDGPATVTITYNATLKSTTGTNTVKINNRSQNPTTTISTATFKMVKVDSENRKALTGAEFNLYNAQTDGQQIKVTKGTDGTYTVDPNGNDKIVVDNDGKATIKGLKEGTTYYLQETKAPAGYTLPTARISITTANDATVPTTDTQITNTKGSALPSTGGMGTTIFYVLGAALVIGAGVVLVTRRKLSK